MTGWMRALLWTLGGLVAVFALLWVFQRRLIYLPSAGVPPVDRALSGWAETQVETADGEHLGVWSIEPRGDSPTVVVFNGNAGNRSHRVPLGRRLAEAGHGVVLFDYRGYGDSTGAPSEHGLRQDATAIARFAEEMSGGGSLVYFGESLGAAIAIRLATEAAPAALILRSPFTSLADVADRHYPLPFDSFLRDRFPSDERIAGVDAPILVIAGSNDSIVPTELSRSLFAAAPDPKELVIIEGAGHNDFALLAGDRMIEAVEGFLERHLGDG